MRKRMLPMLLVLGLLVTACARAPARPVSQVAAVQPSGVTTIRVGVDPSMGTQLNAVIAAFQDSHPQYRVSPVDLSTDVAAKVQQGEVDLIPGVLIWGPTVDQGLILSLDPFINKSRLDLAPYGTWIESERIHGQVYVLPVYGDPTVFAYNPDLVAAVGVTIPPDGWTWDQVRETAARLTHGSGENKVWGLDTVGFTEELAYLTALQKTAAGTVPDGPAARGALAFWNTMIATDRSLAPSILVKVGNDEKLPMSCMKGKAALCVVPLSWLMRLPQYAGLRLAPIPAAPPGKAAITGRIISYGISAKAADPEAAWTFLTFLAGPEGAAILARQGQFPVYSTEATRQAWSESTPPPPAGSDELFHVAWSTKPGEYGPLTPRGVFFMGANRLFAGQTTVDQVVSEYEAALK